jgi:flagellar basal-body rod protein FlgB
MFRETSIAAAEKAMSGLGTRMQAVAANIANAETPGYRPREVEFEAALREAIDRERGSRAPSTSRPIENASVQVRRQAVAPGADITIQLETQMTELARTNGHHEALTRVLGKHFRMLRSVISGGSQS